ncbi:MAG: bile acid:sodium symporter family protein [Gammaproteobacteria bacterium]|nr:bile acid:sodium symporter family protein [Gammaproteobacteria bacterium]
MATLLFPACALLLSAAALVFPAPFVPLAPAIVPLLAAVMFGMGVTLTPAAFARVLARPRVVGFALALQFAVMPAAAWALAAALGLPPALSAGLVLVGTCPGGTASNVVCYLARGDVALSVTLTTVSTALSPVLTPLLTWLLIGRQIPVPVADMLTGIGAIVVLPVALGLLVRRVLGTGIVRLLDWLPVISAAAIVLIIAIVVALNRGQLQGAAGTVAAAVVAHNAAGLVCGYALSRLAGYDVRTCRTLAIEVGMQNSGLGVALAVKYFAAATALPAALFSVWHNLSGACLAAWWRHRDDAMRLRSTSPQP